VYKEKGGGGRGIGGLSDGVIDRVLVGAFHNSNFKCVEFDTFYERN